MNNKWTKFINQFADKTSFNKPADLKTGLLYGGTLDSTYLNNSISIEEGAAQFLIKDGDAEYLKIVTFQGVVAFELASIGTNPYSIIYLNQLGIISQSLEDLEYSSDIVILGIVFHVNGTNVNKIIQYNDLGYGTDQRLDSLLDSIGIVKKEGLKLSTNPATLELNLSSGEIYGKGINKNNGVNNDVVTFTGETSIPIEYVYQDGSGGFTYDNNSGSNYAEVIPGFYDDGGILTALTSSEWSVQRVFYFPNSNEIEIYFGQYKYDSYNSARASLEFEDFNESEITKKHAVFIGYIILNGNATDLSDENECVLLNSGFIRNLPIGGGCNTGSGSIIIDASGVTYDNTTSGLSGTTVQDVIDEVVDLIPISGTTSTPIATYSNKTTFPGVINWQSFHLFNGGAATVSTIANFIRGYPVIIWDDVTIDAIQIRTGTGVAGSLIIGIYKFENGLGTDLVYTSPVFNTGISGYQSFTGQNLFLEKGAYIIAYNTDVVVSLVSGSGIPSLFGEGAPGGAGNQVNVAYAYTGSLPATFPSSTVTVSTFAPIRVQFQLI